MIYQSEINTLITRARLYVETRHLKIETLMNHTQSNKLLNQTFMKTPECIRRNAIMFIIILTQLNQIAIISIS